MFNVYVGLNENSSWDLLPLKDTDQYYTFINISCLGSSLNRLISVEMKQEETRKFPKPENSLTTGPA